MRLFCIVGGLMFFYIGQASRVGNGAMILELPLCLNNVLVLIIRDRGDFVLTLCAKRGEQNA